MRWRASPSAGVAAFYAQVELAGLDGRWWHRICDDAVRAVADRSLVKRVRHRAAEVIIEIGRDGALAALRSITADDTLPVTARAEAARLLVEIRPSSRAEALTVLQGLVGTDNPLHRRQVLLAMGSLGTTEAVPPLRAMTHDRTLGPVVRLRCAEALAEMRRDQRELMRDEAVPRHVRVRAACHLARWSELCRDEARDLLREVDALSGPREHGGRG